MHGKWGSELTAFFVIHGLLVTLVGWTSGDNTGQASCQNCVHYEDTENNIERPMLADGPPADAKINNQCQYPCKCSNAELRCKAGVNVIKDGCDCCYMCARQQGDLCDYRDKCDEVRGLYCDFIFDEGERGICRAKEARSCTFEGNTYKDGEEFKPDCRRLCTCQNGQYACTSLCPQEERRPSSLHCRSPRLVAISGRCCKEWTCPVQRDGVLSEDGNNGIGGGGGMMSRECHKETTPWSSCSVTCGMGVSVRNTNDNEDCIPVQQTRLCFVRPCSLNDKHLTGDDCKTTWRADAAYKLEYAGCTSLREFRPKYCATCKGERCCIPESSKTIQREFECGENKIRVFDIMWIKSCICHEDYCT